MPVQNKLLSLIGAKQAAENKKISIPIVAKETGISTITLYKWQNNDLMRFEAETIEKLCRYFNCQVGDLLFIADEPQKELQA